MVRHRRRKRDGGSVISKTNCDKSYSKEINPVEKATENNKYHWNLLQHIDKNGVTHIEVESAREMSLVNQAAYKPKSVMKLKIPNSEAQLPLSPSEPLSKPEKSKFAIELKNILSSELKNHDEPLSNAGKKALKTYMKKKPPGESLSLHQRAPA